MQNGGSFNDLDHYHMHLYPRYKDDGFGWVEPRNKSNKELEQVRVRILEEIKRII